MIIKLHNYIQKSTHSTKMKGGTVKIISQKKIKLKIKAQPQENLFMW